MFFCFFLWTLLWAKSEPKLSTVSNDTPNNISWTQILDNVWVGFLSVHFISNYCSQMFIHLILSFTSLGHSLSLSWFWAFLPLPSSLYLLGAQHTHLSYSLFSIQFTDHLYCACRCSSGFIFTNTPGYFKYTSKQRLFLHTYSHPTVAI